MIGMAGKLRTGLRMVRWHLPLPKYSESFGIRLPLRHPAITETIRRQIFFGGYEATEAEIVQRKVEATDVVMEIGAGIGFLSALCARLVGDKKVFAYEANPALIEIIRQTHANNGVAPLVNNCVLGQGDGERDFYLERDFWSSSLVRRSDDARQVRVPQRDLGAEIRRIAPTFLIVDIEGGEYELFRGIDLVPIRKLCVELHPHVIGEARTAEVLAWIRAAGLVPDSSCSKHDVYYFQRR